MRVVAEVITMSYVGMTVRVTGIAVTVRVANLVAMCVCMSAI
jgi:hypothetical protein